MSLRLASAWPTNGLLKGGSKQHGVVVACTATHRPTPVLASNAQVLSKKRCVPCEGDSGALGFMGLCEALDRQAAESLLQEVEGWQLVESQEKSLFIERQWKTKNFVKALELCSLIGTVAEDEGHHPDLHITGWNTLTVVLSTHARKGLTENDFIMASKIDEIPKEGLLRKPKAKRQQL